MQAIQSLQLYRKLVLPLLALSITAATFISPTALLPKQVVNVVFIVDITQSMNARDFSNNGQSISRLEAAKATIKTTLKQLPCGSHVGVGMFASKDALLLFNPIELCQHYSLLDQVISRLSWRMAWAGDSNIQRGLYSALGQVAQLENDPTIVFLTDGEQTVSEHYAPPLAKRSGKVNGLIVGIGGKQPVRIPLYDNDDAIIGYWKGKDVKTGNPLNRRSDNDEEYLSQLDITNLREYAQLSKLNILVLENQQQLADLLNSDPYIKQEIHPTDIRWILGILALLLTLLPYALKAKTI